MPSLVRPSPTLRRYVLYQIPGCLLATAAAVVLHYRVNLPTEWGICLIAAWIIKDAALYPLLRVAYETDSPSAIERLIGLEGVTVEPLAPQGYIKVRGELWLAQHHSGMGEVTRGHLVSVCGVRGTVLLVQPTASEATTTTTP